MINLLKPTQCFSNSLFFYFNNIKYFKFLMQIFVILSSKVNHCIKNKTF